MMRIRLIGLFTLFVGAAALPARQGDQLKQALALQDAVQKVIDDAEPSIACILVSRSDQYERFGQGSPRDKPGKLGGLNLKELKEHKDFAALPDGERERWLRRLNLADPGHVPESFGSGVVIDGNKGLILTNYHVVRDATKLYVRLPDRKGSYADIYAADPRSDLAVLRLLDATLKPRPLAPGDGAKVQRGQFVVALANPFAAGYFDGKPSASFGIIANVRRRAPSPAREEERVKSLHHYGTLLQTDVRLTVGCSGGALLDLKGKLIGLTSALAGLHGGEAAGGFAVPLDDGMKRIIEVLKRGEEVEYGFLGVGFDQAAEPGDGVPLVSVATGSPAQRNGLAPKDVILAVKDTVSRTEVHDRDELFLALGTRLAGSTIDLEVRKPSGALKTVTVTLAKFHVPGPKIATELGQRKLFRGLRVDYTSVLVQQPEFNRQEIPNGVLVSEVRPGSAAASAALKPGAVITQVNESKVNSPAEFYEAVAGKQGPVEVTLAPTSAGQPAPKVTIK
jgi:S1-C subfamily serine protease